MNAAPIHAPPLQLYTHATPPLACSLPRPVLVRRPAETGAAATAAAERRTAVRPAAAWHITCMLFCNSNRAGGRYRIASVLPLWQTPITAQGVWPPAVSADPVTQAITSPAPADPGAAKPAGRVHWVSCLPLNCTHPKRILCPSKLLCMYVSTHATKGNHNAV